MKKIINSILFLILTYSSIFATQKFKSFHDLPIILQNSKGTNDKLVIYISGDGGWNKFSQKLTQEIEKHGYGVLSLNSRKYFRNKKTPDIFARDIEQLVNFYMVEWNKRSVMIIGYSFGADVSAFLPRRLPVNILSKMDHMALLSPSLSSDFVINLKDLIGDSRNTKRKYKIGPEIASSVLPIVCIFGKDKDLKLKNTPVKSKRLIVDKLPGNHHYKDNTSLLIKMIGLESGFKAMREEK